MQRFDCLSEKTPLLGAHFLEASAGTGKTFAIEHLVVRLLFSLEWEQILLVTFTRAATRELKLRIRNNLQKVHLALIEKTALWDYLIPHLGSAEAIARIGLALATFDRSQIFTIHSFCYRMLKEYAFEAGFSFSKQEEGSSLDAALHDFLELKLTNDLVAPAQMGLLLRAVKSAEQLVRKLKKEEPSIATKNYREWSDAFRTTLAQFGPIDRQLLIEDFQALKDSYKVKKGRFESQLNALATGTLDPLVAEKGSLFEFLSQENRKIRATAPKHLHYPGFFEWAYTHLYPLILEAADPKRIFQTILRVWKPIQQRLEAQEEERDAIIKTMRQAIENDRFKECVQKKYKAVIIDEFQDTDPDQWAIFRTLFLSSCDALYLIGDPKQSIYRFRKADLYTYLEAKESFSSHFYLDTNYRSSKQLIGALNHLFDRPWLKLPKQNRALPYLPIQAGLDVAIDWEDGKGAIHCLLYQEAQDLYSWMAQEIIRLKKPYSSFAILVKDRYMGRAIQQHLSSYGVPSLAKSQEPLAETLAFEAIWELFEALQSPRQNGKVKTVLAGPFSGLSVEQLLTADGSPFFALRTVLDEKGLPVCCQAFWQSSLGRLTVQEEAAARGPSFYSDCLQVFEAILEWERNEGFSFEGLFRFLEDLHSRPLEEALCRRRESDADAVQIMTMHVSKGLEFDIVFAPGLSARTPEGDEEADAEKLRQLYVAMTRAKRRLYLPILTGEEAEPGTLSPIELFCQTLGGNWREEMGKIGNLTIESVLASGDLPHIVQKNNVQLHAPQPISCSYTPSHLLSFTALSRPSSHERAARRNPGPSGPGQASYLSICGKEVAAPYQSGETPPFQGGVLQFLEPLPEPNGHYTPHNLPRGAETGVAIHQLFETLFAEKKPIEQIVEEQLFGSLLYPWKEVVVDMIHSTLHLLLPQGFSLVDVSEQKILIEREFLFGQQSDYIKGFIDLVFQQGGKLYFVDWKTNWLGDCSESYTTAAIQAAMVEHEYDLQAKLYTQAIQKAWEDRSDQPFQEVFGGAIYLFVRAPAAYCFNPLEDK